MARTRGISEAYLDRQGNPISPSAAYLAKAPRLSGSTVLEGPGAEPVPPPAKIIGYRASPKSWSRDLDAWELAHLLNMALKQPKHLGDGFIIEVTEDEFARLPGDLRRHFMPVRRG